MAGEMEKQSGPLDLEGEGAGGRESPIVKTALALRQTGRQRDKDLLSERLTHP